MPSLAEARVTKELNNIQQSKSLKEEGTAVEAVGGSLSELVGTIQGPKETPYEGGTFKLKILIPSSYPFSAPKINFVTKVWHPNISSVTGAICLDVLGKNWAASMTIQAMLISIQCLMDQPDPGNPQDAVVGSQVLNNPEVFKATAKYWTQVYANGPGERNAELEGKVEKVTELGFSRNQAVTALSTNGWRLDPTIDKLLGEMSHEEKDEKKDEKK